jgi:hypothetical protein
MDPVQARKTWRTLEPLHGMIYFVPESAEEYAAAGLKGGRMGYFASRSAAMGPVPAEVVIATFFNFNPALITRVIPDAWSLAAPSAILRARLDAADRALRRALPADVLTSDALSEAAALARTAAQAGAERPQGRPLFAAHASLPWPIEPHLVLWHAQTLLREYRGDGHVASLLMAELDPVEALVTHAATGDVPAATLQATRGWPDADWAAAVDRLQARGIVAPGDALVFTDHGRRLRQEIEDQTDALSVGAYRALGDDGCNRLRELGRPLSQAVIAAGLLNIDFARYLEPE